MKTCLTFFLQENTSTMANTYDDQGFFQPGNYEQQGTYDMGGAAGADFSQEP